MPLITNKIDLNCGTEIPCLPYGGEIFPPVKEKSFHNMPLGFQDDRIWLFLMQRRKMKLWITLLIKMELTNSCYPRPYLDPA